MHLQRALLLIAIVLGLTALAASLAPAPKKRATSAPTAPPTTATSPPTPAAAPQQLSFRATPSGRRLTVRTAPVGGHVVIQVKVATAGDVAIPSLGLTASAEPGTPAMFDVIVPAGRADVTFAEPFAPPRTIGALVGKG